MLQPGDTLAGYRIDAIAGVGGMGIVYRATQVSLDRSVALKVLSSTLVGNRTFRERFRREGRHAAALEHPNIIPVYEAGESNGLMFIAMRLVDGPTLADLIERRLLNGRETMRILTAIASALDAAHEVGLVHRDVKPQNILLTNTGHPYLADFGITKGSDRGGLTKTGDFVGSLNYVAPEQISGDEVSAMTDVYALTAVLFHCLSGAYPYECDSDVALMRAHLSDSPPTFDDLGVDVPAALDEVFRTGMAKQPEQRFATASALVAACNAALEAVDPAWLTALPAFGLPGTDEHDEEEYEDALVEPPEWARDGYEKRPRYAPTAREVRRPAAAEVPADAAPRDRRGRARRVLLAAVAAVAATVLGYALGQDDPAQATTARSAALTLEHDNAWTPSSGTIEGLELSDTVTLRRRDGVRLVAGRMIRFASGYAPLPSTLRIRLASKPATAVITLGSASARRYAADLRSGERLWLAFVPDTRGWIAIACEGPGADRRDVCAPVAATLAVIGARSVTLGPDEATAAQISKDVGELNTARSAAADDLGSRSTRTRAAAARRLAAAHQRAAATLSDLALRPQERSAIMALADALDGEQTRLVQLARAASRRQRARYNDARAAVARAEMRVHRAVRHLRAIGYVSS